MQPRYIIIPIWEVLCAVNGLTFNEQSISSLNECIDEFEKKIFNSNLIADSIKKYSNERFKEEFLKNINKIYEK